MSSSAKKSIGSTMLLILLGVTAIYCGAASLTILIPAALLVWLGVRPALRGGRN